jgi:hypothetical protein
VRSGHSRRKKGSIFLLCCVLFVRYRVTAHFLSCPSNRLATTVHILQLPSLELARDQSPLFGFCALSIAFRNFSHCYTRSSPSYKLLLEYNLLLTQRLASHPLALVVLHCGSSSIARVANELPLGVLWLLCVAGTSFARSTAQLS